MDDTTHLRVDDGAAEPVWPPRPARSLAEDAYEVLKRAIVRCELAPGQHASESYLVEQFGLGRSAIRSALSRLVQGDLVRSVARKGHIIAPITFRRVKEVFDVRMQLEPLAAERAAADPRGLAYLQVLDEESRRATYRLGDRDAVDRFLRANTRLHVEVVAAGGNQLMADLITDLLHESERFFHLALRVTDRNDEMYHEHHELIDALLAADGPRARELAADAIRASEIMVTRALMTSSALLEANISTLRGQCLPSPRQLATSEVVHPSAEGSGFPSGWSWTAGWLTATRVTWRGSATYLAAALDRSSRPLGSPPACW